MAQNVYDLAISIHKAFDVPVFPVRVTEDVVRKRVNKVPVVKWRDLDGVADVGWDWKSVSAVGVPMGEQSGLITIDLDDYKGKDAQRWMKKQKLPLTLTHGTASGGRHLIFEMPEGYNLGNNAPDVCGVDIRCTGGYIVWADVNGKYTVIDDRPPAMLPKHVADLLQALRDASGSERLIDLPKRMPVDDKALVRKLQVTMAQLKNVSLVDRFVRGSTTGMKDSSRSAMDMSVAGLLARRGFTYSEIVQILLYHFEHGSAARDGQTDDVERGAMRCAARAVREEEKRTAKFEQSRFELMKQLLNYSAKVHRKAAP